MTDWLEEGIGPREVLERLCLRLLEKGCSKRSVKKFRRDVEHEWYLDGKDL